VRVHECGWWVVHVVVCCAHSTVISFRVPVSGACLWHDFFGAARCDLDLVLEAHHVRRMVESKTIAAITPEQRKEFEEFWVAHADHPLRARDVIIRSICPQLYGLYMVKLSVAMTLIGGVQQVDASGTRIRGESHLLLVGDPGTGKSQLLRYGAKISPRSVMTTGIGTTSAGLTVTVVKDTGGDWALEAGALVLADGGLCCIDEFDSIRETDRATIHEAMEQQTLSVAKAGLVATLNTRATVFAAVNPKGTFDDSADLSINTAIASPLLSRFDMVLLLLDNQDADWDKRVCAHILDSLDYFQPAVEPSIADLAALTQGPVVPPSQASGTAARARLLSKPEPDWFSLEKMQAYFSHVKKSMLPKMTRFSELILIRYYALQRRADGRNAARTTIRLLESLVRLAQSHARLCFRTVVLPQDSITAVYLLECSMNSSSLLGLKSIMHSSSPDDPDSVYLEQAAFVLGKLGLDAVPPAECHFDYGRLKFDFETGTYHCHDFVLNDGDLHANMHDTHDTDEVAAHEDLRALTQAPVVARDAAAVSPASTHPHLPLPSVQPDPSSPPPSPPPAAPNPISAVPSVFSRSASTVYGAPKRPAVTEPQVAKFSRVTY
jgi:DNA helicase MCM9